MNIASGFVIHEDISPFISFDIHFNYVMTERPIEELETEWDKISPLLIQALNDLENETDFNEEDIAVSVDEDDNIHRFYIYCILHFFPNFVIYWFSLCSSFRQINKQD